METSSIIVLLSLFGGASIEEGATPPSIIVEEFYEAPQTVSTLSIMCHSVEVTAKVSSQGRSPSEFSIFVDGQEMSRHHPSLVEPTAFLGQTAEAIVAGAACGTGSSVTFLFQGIDLNPQPSETGEVQSGFSIELDLD